MIVTFPERLRPTPAPVSICEPGLLAKKISDLYETIHAKTGNSSISSGLTFRVQYLRPWLDITFFWG
jgi:hypothetical protein